MCLCIIRLVIVTCCYCILLCWCLCDRQCACRICNAVVALHCIACWCDRIFSYVLARYSACCICDCICSQCSCDCCVEIWICCAIDLAMVIRCHCHCLFSNFQYTTNICYFILFIFIICKNFRIIRRSKLDFVLSRINFSF